MVFNICHLPIQAGLNKALIQILIDDSQAAYVGRVYKRLLSVLLITISINLTSGYALYVS